MLAAAACIHESGKLFIITLAQVVLGEVQKRPLLA